MDRIFYSGRIFLIKILAFFFFFIALAISLHCPASILLRFEKTKKSLSASSEEYNGGSSESAQFCHRFQWVLTKWIGWLWVAFRTELSSVTAPLNVHLIWHLWNLANHLRVAQKPDNTTKLFFGISSISYRSKFFLFFNKL